MKLSVIALILATITAPANGDESPNEKSIHHDLRRLMGHTPSVGTCKDGGSGMVSTADPIATQVGLDVLEAGGTAVDAMVAVQAVLGLVEPQSSGLGGGSFAVYYDAGTNSITCDGRETAPSAATEDRFAAFPPGFQGFAGAWQSGLSVGVPGTPLLMHTMHDKYGNMPMSDLFQPAIDLAINGFPLGGRSYGLASFLFGRFNSDCDQRLFFRDPTAFAYMVNSETCEIKPPGTNMTNPEYAATLEKIATLGAMDGFYKGEVAAAIAAAVQSDLGIPGDMTVEDLESYTVIEREPVCIDFGSDSVCSMGPPSSGGLAVGQIMGLLEAIQDKVIKSSVDDSHQKDVLDPTNVHLFTQAGRLAFADRNKFVGDPDFVSVPAEGMLNKDYLAERALLINATSDMGTAAAGTPPGSEGMSMAIDQSVKTTGTSQISIVDSYGNALSVTSSSIEAPFGITES